MLQEPCSTHGRRGEADATAALRPEGRRRGGGAQMSCHREMQGESSATRRKSSMRAVKEVVGCWR